MAEIAAEAGLPKANLHYYFGTKERLYRAVLERILTQWLDAAAEWIVPERDPAEALGGYVRAKLLDARTRPGASRIFAGEVLRGAPLLMPFLRGELRRRVDAMGSGDRELGGARPDGPDAARSSVLLHLGDDADLRRFRRADPRRAWRGCQGGRHSRRRDRDGDGAGSQGLRCARGMSDNRKRSIR